MSSSLPDEADLIARGQAGDGSAWSWLWKKHGQFIQLSMLDHAHATGGTSTRWGEESTIVEYNTIIVVDEDSGEVVRDEGVVDYAEPSTASNQEGSLEQELRSRAYDVLVSATKSFDPQHGTPYRTWLWICARNAARDIKKRRPAGLVGKSRKADAAVRAEPYQSELEAGAIADRILQIRSEPYVRRWCERSDVDDVDRDVVSLHLIRLPSRNGSQLPFHSLADIAARHGISRQAVAKRRDRIVDDLIGATNKRRSDGASRCRNGRALGSWLSDFQRPRILIRGRQYRQHRDRWETLVDGRWLRINLSDDPVLSSHKDGKITNAELDLIHEYQSAFESFAHGTGFNLGWGAAWKDAPKMIESTSLSTDDMRDFFEGEPDGAVRLLTAHQKEAFQTIAICRRELGLDRKPEAQRVPVPVKWAQLFYPFGYAKRRHKGAPPKPFFVRNAWRCDGFEPLIAAPPLQPENEREFVPIVSTVSTQGA